MKRLIALLILILAARLPPARAQQGPDDQYIIIYSLMQQADTLDSSGQPRQALAQYIQVQDELQKFQKVYPDWSPRIVNFRLKYLAEKIAELTAKLPVIPQSGTPPPAPPPPGAASSTSATDLEAQFGALHEQVQKLQVDNTTLQAKLQEALAAQPAAVDARELTQARAKIRSLMKENDLLKVSLSQGKAGTAIGPAVAESDALKLAELALAEANQKLAGQTARADKLALENQALQSRVQALLASPETIQALREENALLKKQIADFKAAAPDPAEAARLNSELDRDAETDCRVAVGFRSELSGKVGPGKSRAAIADRGGEFRADPGAQPGGKRGAHPGVDAGAQQFAGETGRGEPGALRPPETGRRGANQRR